MRNIRSQHGIRDSLPGLRQGPLLERPLVFPSIQPLDQLFGVVINPNGISVEVLAIHKRHRLFRGVEIVHLAFEMVAVWVAIIHARRSSMVDAPDGQQVSRLALLVRLSEVDKRVVPERDMLEPCVGSAELLVLDPVVLQDADPVVLVVEADEADFLMV